MLEKYDAEVVRFFILRAHYRSPLNYSDAHLDDAKLALTRLYTALRGHVVTDAAIDWQHPQAVRFKAAMDDDFNTAEAMAVLFDLASEVNKTQSMQAVSLLKNLGGLLGLLENNPNEFLQGKIISNATSCAPTDGGDSSNALTGAGFDNSQIEALIHSRIEGKKAKNFAEADRIRQQLADAGIILEDTPQGTTWRRA